MWAARRDILLSREVAVKLRLLMREELVSVLPEMSADLALRAMQDHDFHHFPVVDTDSQLVGVVSDRDLLRHAESLRSLRVTDVMSTPAICMSPEASVAEAAALMIQDHLSCIPLLEDGALVGIVTHIDLLSLLSRDL